VAHRFRPDMPITIRTGGGSDDIAVPSDVRVRVTVLGGKGDEQIAAANGDTRVFGLSGNDHIAGGANIDHISGGSGDDYLEGGAGDDVLSGRTGHDVIYGMGGNDQLSGGVGNDYLEGATGNDVLYGGAGNDIVSGGRGNDLLQGDAGKDHVIGGEGSDTVHGGPGEDVGWLESGERSTGVEHEVRIQFRPGLGDGFIRLVGSADFTARVAADLDLFRSIGEGQLVLEYFDKHHKKTEGWVTGGETVTIRESASNSVESTTYLLYWNRYAVEYDTKWREKVDGAPPVVALWHELAGHVRQHTAETYDQTPYRGVDVIDHGVRRSERTAIGLPVDHDGNPRTPEEADPAHPTVFTENALRRTWGLPERLHYNQRP
jgi:hypothetical protein